MLRRVILVVVGLLIGTGSAGAQHAGLKSIVDRYWQEQLRKNALLRQRLGLPVDSLPELTIAHTRQDSAFAFGILRELKAIPTNGLTHDEELTRETLAWGLANQLEAPRFFYFTNAVTPYASPLPAIHRVFTGFAIKTDSDLDRYLALAAQYTGLIRNIQALMQAEAARGYVLPKVELEQVVPFIRSLAPPAEKSPLWVSDSRLTGRDQQKVEAFRAALAEVLTGQVKPAVDDLALYVEGAYRAKAPDKVGLSQYPGGEAYYRFLVRTSTTSNVTPEQIFKIGLAEVERNTRGLDRIRREVGFQGSLAQFREALKKDKRFYVATPDEVGARLLKYSQSVEQSVDKFFLRRPKAPYTVARLAPELEPTMTFGYYQEPTRADTVGKYYYNGSKLGERSLLVAAALALHELVPGHHFQIGLQRENDSLPAFRRETNYTAYSEGWGDYAAALGNEMGVYTDPYDRAGWLSMRMFVSVRLVVDVGMNLEGWSRERAMQYMRDHVFESETQIASETLRYSVDIPGQALAYRMGSLTFTQLRERAQRALGAKFDIRRFHGAILGVGSLPMAVLESHVDWFIRQEGKNARAGDRLLDFGSLVKGGTIEPPWMADGHSFWYVEGAPAT